MKSLKHGYLILSLAATALAMSAMPALAAKKTGVDLVWPSPPEKPRYRYLESIRSSDDIEAGVMASLRRFVLGRNSAAVQMKLPYGVAVDSKGRLYVADYGYGTVAVFDRKLHKAWYLGRTATSTLAGPVGLAVGRDDTIFVADSKQRKVLKFSARGDVLYILGTKPGDFDNPAGVAVDRERDILYVVDSQAHQVVKFRASDGARLGSIGRRGSEPGSFNYPTNVWVEQSSGRLFVSDTMNFRVQMFGPDGSFRGGFGEPGDGPGQFARARGLAVDAEGHVYVVDAAFNNFQVFDQTGQLLLWVGQPGVEPGQFNSPGGIFVDDQNRVYVADRLNARVQVFQFLGGK